MDDDGAVSKKRKLARKQVDEPVTLGREAPRPAGTVNLWSGRTLREHRAPREGRGVRNLSGYRCRPAADAGWTRGEGAGVPHFCLYFARGLCHLGPACSFRHRVPTAADAAALARDHALDCFGKERSGSDAFRAGSKGAGSLSRDCTTLYVWLGAAAHAAPAAELEAALASDFGEWGGVADVHAAPAKAVAFVRFASRAGAEFAKAAMHQQRLEALDASSGAAAGAEYVLDVRWADDDSNPAAAAAELARRQAALARAREAAADAAGPDAKRARVLGDALAAAHRPGEATAEYPDTSAQFEARRAAPSARAAAWGHERQEHAREQQQHAAAAGAAGEDDGEGAAEALGLIGGYGDSDDGSGG